jgi:hypothetical protein
LDENIYKNKIGFRGFKSSKINTSPIFTSSVVNFVYLDRNCRPLTTAITGDMENCLPFFVALL